MRHFNRYSFLASARFKALKVSFEDYFSCNKNQIPAKGGSGGSSSSSDGFV